MGGSFYHSGESAGFQNEKWINSTKDKISKNETDPSIRDRDSDLVIEDNTIYEIDRECYERLKKQRKGKKIYPHGSI
jgi:hypothetical protein